jgi:hypothetical protein
MAKYTLRRKTFGLISTVAKMGTGKKLLLGAGLAGAAGAAVIGAKGASKAKEIATGNMGKEEGEGY